MLYNTLYLMCFTTVTIFLTQLPDTAKPFQTTPTSNEQQSSTSSGTVSNTSQDVIHEIFISANSKTASHSTVLLTVSNTLAPAHDFLVIGQGPEYVHHNFHRGWVYVWHFPSDTTKIGFLMFCHIILVALGFFLILAAIYSICRMSKNIDKLEAEHAQG